MKKYYVIILMLCTSVVYSQNDNSQSNDINPLRIGVKIGTPNILGANLEFVLPAFNNHLAIFGDYSGFSTDIDDVDTNLKYIEFGANLYFKETGKGFYGSLSYGKLDLEGSYTDAQTLGGEYFTGEAYGELEVSTVNVKLGVKLGKAFYFRSEIGYGFGDIPQEIEITGNVNGTPDTGMEEIPDVPGIGESGYALFNFGIGVSF
jgi:hypothetical protein